MARIIYDIETYPNVFTLATVGAETDATAVFELSPWRDDREALLDWLRTLYVNQVEMIGFNNEGFDYPVIHLLMSNPTATVADLYNKAQAIIDGDRFAHTVWPSDRYLKQIDLFKIHHFDNKAKSTSLKALQFNMRADSVEDLPIPPKTVLTREQVPILREYNIHDVMETKRFYQHSRELIDFRAVLSERYGRDFTNHNDTKIGKDYFVMRLEESQPGICYTGKPRSPRQTHREYINLGDVILPFVRFDHPEFNRIVDYFRTQRITETKGVFTDLHCTINDFTYHFGVGGIHGSVTRQHIKSDDEYMLIDLDVTSYYPSLAITNRLHPAHLGSLFCDVYQDVFNQRVSYKKGSPENQMLKLALNGVYGDSNNIYSPFYDPQYMMSITINGQLLLCMLAERLGATVPGLSMIQINTDGLTIHIPRRYEWIVSECRAWWEGVTKLQLESVEYKEMFIRDVNNYLAVDTDGNVKRKGAYESAPPGERKPLGWHQDCSALVVPKAAEQVILNGVSAEDAVRSNRDPFDFMLRVKAKRGSHLRHGATPVQKTTRYYITTSGEQLVKVSPPPTGCVIGHYKKAQGVSDATYFRNDNTVWNPDMHTKNKSQHAQRETSVQAGWSVAICNDASAFQWGNVAYEWYISEVKKLVDI